MAWLVWGLAAIVLIAVAVFVWRRIILTGPIGHWLYGAPHIPRIEVIEVAPFDAKRRLVLIRRDNVEHLVLTGGPVDVVIENGITPVVVDAPPANVANDPPHVTAAPEPTSHAAHWQGTESEALAYATRYANPPQLPTAGDTAQTHAQNPTVENSEAEQTAQAFKAELVAERREDTNA